MSKVRKNRLGRGLSSLLSGSVAIEPPTESPDPVSISGGSESVSRPPRVAQTSAVAESTVVADGVRLVYLPIPSITPNPYQPRRTFDDATLDELAASIRQDGVMQPIVVRPTPGTDAAAYQLVAGERRWRAAERAGLERVPAVVRSLDDRQVAEWAVIENLQREDLNAIDRAEAFARLVDRFGLRHEDVADRVGINRVSVTNFLRLLDLSDEVQELVRLGKLTAGHGRALLAIDESAAPGAQLDIARKAVSGGWSVRTIEATVKRLTRPIDAPTPKRDTRAAHYADLERRISSQLKTRVHIKPGRKKGAGSIEIEFHGLDAFDALMDRLGVQVD